MCDNVQTTPRAGVLNEFAFTEAALYGGNMMDFSKAIAIQRSPKLAVTLQIIACIVAAVWLTAVADLLVIHLIDWAAVR